MSERPQHWGAETLWQELEPLLPGLSIEVVARSASTNTALLDRARIAPQRSATFDPDGELVRVRRSVESAAFGRRAVDVQPCLLVAEHQTGGRGRQGRSWQSVPGASLTFSLALPLTMADWSGLSLAVGVALAEALEPDATTPPRIGLKWPNDLWLRDVGGAGRKLGGVLIETVSGGSGRLVVIGVGLNVAPIDVPEASSGLAALQELDPGVTGPLALRRVARPLAQALHDFERHGGFAFFQERYAARDLLAGQPVRTTHPQALEGVARGVTDHGALRVETERGLVEVASGEVSVRLAQATAAAAGAGC